MRALAVGVTVSRQYLKKKEKKRKKKKKKRKRKKRKRKRNLSFSGNVDILPLALVYTAACMSESEPTGKFMVICHAAVRAMHVNGRS
jgi:hypothetical protein